LQGKNILPQGTNRVTRFLIHRFGERYLHHFNYQPCTPDVLIKHRYYIAETNNHIELMHTPGHTKGCLSVIVDNELAIVGDAMFGVFPGSIFPPYGNDVRQMVESWEKLLETSCRLFIPAHGSANKRDLVQKCYSRRKQKTI
jgi:glyoxylase-like metal-dependent hydrolase (beta-lactamase superfamily II)